MSARSRARRPGLVVGPRMECASRQALLLTDIDRPQLVTRAQKILKTRAQTKTPPRFPGAAFSYSNIERGRFLVLGRPGSDLLSQGLSHSTIGAEEFNGRVRDGIGLRLFAKTTRPAKDKKTKQAIFIWRLAPLIHSGQDLAILWTLKMRAIKPIERLVPVSYMHYCTSTSGLSTWSSSTVLKGMLVLRWVSRLDAFSGYPVRT